MIKPEELRIGNLVTWTRKYEDLPSQQVEVFNIVQSFFRAYTSIEELSEVIVDYNHAEPIPLNEKWLIDFGFHNNGNSIFDIKIQPQGLKKLVVFNAGFNGWNIGFADYYTGKETTETLPTLINSVHQLQNFFFAITGEELKIK